MASDTAVRFGVYQIKMLSYVRQPSYELLADSFIEECVRTILRFAEQSEEVQVRELGLFLRKAGVKRKEPELEEAE